MQRAHVLEMFFFPELFFLVSLTVTGTLLSKTKFIQNAKMESPQTACSLCHRGKNINWIRLSLLM